LGCGCEFLEGRWKVIRVKTDFSKNKLLRFAHHENDRVVGSIDLARPTIDLKSLGDAHRNYTSFISGKPVS